MDVQIREVDDGSRIGISVEQREVDCVTYAEGTQCVVGGVRLTGLRCADGSIRIKNLDAPESDWVEVEWSDLVAAEDQPGDK